MADIYKSKAIVLRTLKYRETSLIADLYTREKGLRSFIINGVRSNRKSKKTSLYSVMSIVDIVAYEKPNNKLARIKEAKLALIYEKLPFNVIKSSIGLLMTEIARNAIKEQDSQPELFDFLAAWFSYLDKHAVVLKHIPLLFLVELSHYLGISPDNNYNNDQTIFDLENGRFESDIQHLKWSLPAEQSQHLHSLLSTKKSSIDQLKIPKEVRTPLLKNLIKYYQYHLPNFADLKSLEVLTQVLS